MKTTFLLSLLFLFNVAIINAYDTTINPNLELVKDQRSVSYAHLLSKRELLKKDLALAKRYGEDSDVIAVMKDQLEIINTAIENFNSSWVVLKDDQIEEASTSSDDDHTAKIIVASSGAACACMALIVASYDETMPYKLTLPSLGRLQANTLSLCNAFYAMINR